MGVRAVFWQNGLLFRFSGHFHPLTLCISLAKRGANAGKNRWISTTLHSIESFTFITRLAGLFPKIFLFFSRFSPDFPDSCRIFPILAEFFRISPRITGWFPTHCCSSNCWVTKFIFSLPSIFCSFTFLPSVSVGRSWPSFLRLSAAVRPLRISSRDRRPAPNARRAASYRVPSARYAEGTSVLSNFQRTKNQSHLMKCSRVGASWPAVSAARVRRSAPG